MLAAHLDDPGLEGRRHLVRTAAWPRAAVGEAGHALSRVAPQPAVHRLAPDAVATCDVGDAGGAVQHLEHGLIALFHEPQLPEHDDLPGCGGNRRWEGAAEWREGPRSGVAEVPEPVSPRYRSRVRGMSHRYRSQSVAWLPKPHNVYMCVMEREMGFEPTALCLGSTLADPDCGPTSATEMSPNCDRPSHFENFGKRSRQGFARFARTSRES